MIKLKSLTEDFFDEKIENLIHEITINIFQHFLNNNNPKMTKHIPWKVIPFPQLKNVWESFMKYGHVRNEKVLNDMADLMIYNVCKVYILTELTGHTRTNPEEIFEENLGNYIDKYLLYRKVKKFQYDKNQMSFKFYKKITAKKIENPYLDEYIENKGLDGEKDEILKPELMEALKDVFFDYYIEDPKSGQAYISDYALDPLMDLAFKLNKEKNAEKKIVLMDRMLNIIHQRSDIAAWFVQGGRDSLMKLSGYGEENSKLGNEID